MALPCNPGGGEIRQKRKERGNIDENKDKKVRKKMRTWKERGLWDADEK